MGALGQRLGQGQAREAGTEKSDVSGANLSRAKGQFDAQPGWRASLKLMAQHA
jgi:hypothetical protein